MEAFASGGLPTRPLEVIRAGVLYGIRFDRLKALHTSSEYSRYARLILQELLIQNELKHRLMAKRPYPRYEYFIKTDEGLAAKSEEGWLASFLGMDEKEFKRYKMIYEHRRKI
jgi:hypothetical protein